MYVWDIRSTGPFKTPLRAQLAENYVIESMSAVMQALLSYSYGMRPMCSHGPDAVIT